MKKFPTSVKTLETLGHIDSFIAPRGCLTKPGDDNHGGSHADLHQPLLQELGL